MKRIKLLIMIFICLIAFGVKADMEPPIIVSHQVMVTNKNGAVCYDVDGKKTDKVIPYGTTLEVFHEINGSFIDVQNDKYSCTVKYSDVSAKSQKFNVNGSSEGLEKIEPVYAIVLAKSGLNLRKGPSVTYSKIVTIPQNTVLKLTHQAGTYWYYTEYNGKTGWVTAMNNYLGIDGKETLVNYEPVNIYDSNNKIIGKIPANTEVTTYLILNAGYNSEYVDKSVFPYYVIYNGTKGYVRNMFYKTNGTGKIKLIKDYIIKDNKGKELKKITAGQELEYTMISSTNDTIYIPEKGITMYFEDGEFEFVKEADILIKKTGYIGEGLFGEAKIEKKEEPKEEKEDIPEPVIEKDKETFSTKEIIIIGLLAGIFLALTALVVIKLVNTKKTKKENVTIVDNTKSAEEIKNDVENEK